MTMGSVCVCVWVLIAYYTTLRIYCVQWNESCNPCYIIIKLNSWRPPLPSLFNLSHVVNNELMKFCCLHENRKRMDKRMATVNRVRTYRTASLCVFLLYTKIICILHYVLVFQSLISVSFVSGCVPCFYRRFLVLYRPWCLQYIRSILRR